MHLNFLFFSVCFKFKFSFGSFFLTSPPLQRVTAMIHSDDNDDFCVMLAHFWPSSEAKAAFSALTIVLQAERWSVCVRACLNVCS